MRVLIDNIAPKVNGDIRSEVFVTPAQAEFPGCTRTVIG